MPALVSIVCPAYKEEEVLPLFHDALMDVVDRLDDAYRVEIIYVDDGSPDGTLQVLKALANQDDRVRYLALSRNFGKEAALLAGLEHARGEAVITLDTDLQHPPALIPALLQKWRAGFEVVLTTKEADHTLGPVKRLSSRMFYRWMGRFSQVDFVPALADFCLLGRQAVASLVRLRECHRFMRGLVQWLGFRVAWVAFRPAERPAGQSKYNLFRLAALASDGIFSFSCVPLRCASYLGLLAFLIGIGHAAWLVLAGAGAQETPGLGYLASATHILGGAILCCLGILGGYVGRVFDEVRERPAYLLQDQDIQHDSRVDLARERTASCAPTLATRAARI